MSFPINFSIEGKTIKVYSDGIIELSEGYYDISFKNLKEAVSLAEELKNKDSSSTKNGIDNSQDTRIEKITGEEPVAEQVGLRQISPDNIHQQNKELLDKDYDKKDREMSEKYLKKMYREGDAS